METYFLLAAGAMAGGFVNGLAGFGTSMFALGFWLQIMPPVQAVSVVVVMAVLSGLQGAWIVRRSVLDHPRRLARFLLPALLGIPLGVAALSVLDPHYLKIGIAGIMIIYGGFFSLRASLPKFDRPTPVIDGVVGFLGGLLGGAASLSGALPTMWCSMRTWPKWETRAVLQPFNITVLALTAIIFAFRGNYTPQVLTMIAIAFPTTMISAQIGIALFKRLTDNQFRRLLITLMFASGVVLMIKEMI